MTHLEDPSLTGSFDALFPSVWPEYNLHSDVLSPLWGRLYERFPQFQFVLVDDTTGDLLARGNSVPFAWDGTPEGLPPGIDAVAEAALGHAEGPPEALSAMAAEVPPEAALGPAEGAGATALSAMAAEVPPEHRGKGLGTRLLQTMSALAAGAGLRHLVAPVRPSLKELYPLTPIDEYAGWKTAEGRVFDPWMRLHTNLGAVVVKPAPRSLRITGTVAEWESWTGMAFPATGTYVIPRGLSTLEIDRRAGSGHYWEPNVWMRHPDLGSAEDQHHQ